MVGVLGADSELGPGGGKYRVPDVSQSLSTRTGKIFLGFLEDILFRYVCVCFFQNYGSQEKSIWSIALFSHSNTNKYLWLTTLVNFLLTLHLVSSGLIAAFLEPCLKEHPPSSPWNMPFLWQRERTGKRMATYSDFKNFCSVEVYITSLTCHWSKQ